MAVKYFAGIRPLITGRFLIHREGCLFMPDENEFIGSFENTNDALNSSEGKYRREPCIFCCKEQFLNKDLFKFTTSKPLLISAAHFSNESRFLPGTYIN